MDKSCKSWSIKDSHIKSSVEYWKHWYIKSWGDITLTLNFVSEYISSTQETLLSVQDLCFKIVEQKLSNFSSNHLESTKSKFSFASSSFV